MMMFRFLISAFGLLLITSSLTAQESNSENYSANDSFQERMMKQYTRGIDSPVMSLKDIGSYLGSPFLYENGKKAFVYLNDGKVEGAPFLNIDTYSNTFAISDHDNFKNSYVKIDPTIIYKVVVLSNEKTKRKQVFVYETAEYKNETIGVCELVYEAPDRSYKVYLHTDCKFKGRQSASNLYAGTNVSKFVQTKHLFIKPASKDIIEVSNKKDFINQFNVDKKKAKKLFKEIDINIKKSNQLKLFFTAMPNLRLKEDL